MHSDFLNSWRKSDSRNFRRSVTQRIVTYCRNGMSFDFGWDIKFKFQILTEKFTGISRNHCRSVVTDGINKRCHIIRIVFFTQLFHIVGYSRFALFVPFHTVVGVVNAPRICRRSKRRGKQYRCTERGTNHFFKCIIISLSSMLLYGYNSIFFRD